jgi:hypothetical protein
MNTSVDVKALMQQPLTADELVKWPLMHGTLCNGDELAKGVGTLKSLMDAQKAVLPDGYRKELLMEVVRCKQFKDYYSRNYQIPAAELFKHVEDEARSWKLSMQQYFMRTGIWPLHEEILVPRLVEPELLLGHWDGQYWTEWRKSSSPDGQVRLEAWIQTAAMRGRNARNDDIDFRNCTD